MRFQWYCKEQLVKMLLKNLSKTSMVESNFELNFRTACMELYENWTLPRIFFEIYSASKKLHIAFCMLYPVSGVKLLLNCKHFLGRKNYVAFYTSKGHLKSFWEILQSGISSEELAFCEISHFAYFPKILVFSPYIRMGRFCNSLW